MDKGDAIQQKEHKVGEISFSNRAKLDEDTVRNKYYLEIKIRSMSIDALGA